MLLAQCLGNCRMSVHQAATPLDHSGRMHVQAADTMGDTELLQRLYAAQRSRVRAAVAAARLPLMAARPASPNLHSHHSHNPSDAAPEGATSGCRLAAAAPGHLPGASSGQETEHRRNAPSALLRLLCCARPGALKRSRLPTLRATHCPPSCMSG